MERFSREESTMTKHFIELMDFIGSEKEVNDLMDRHFKSMGGQT